MMAIEYGESFESEMSCELALVDREHATYSCPQLESDNRLPETKDRVQCWQIDIDLLQHFTHKRVLE